MIDSVAAAIGGFIVATISGMGYGGVLVLMTIESACIPLPSEIVMTFSGYLVATGQFNLWGVALAGALGNVLGALIAWYVGRQGGRALVEKYGRFILVSAHDLDRADRWFARYGELGVFISRLLPVIRTFISFPAGIARMDLRRFIILTFAGSYLWCLALATVGKQLGDHWEEVENYFHRFDVLIVALALIALAWYVWRHIKQRRRERRGARAGD
jgi:membrane protein DedA with SNARE-associated domain